MSKTDIDWNAPIIVHRRTDRPVLVPVAFFADLSDAYETGLSSWLVGTGVTSFYLRGLIAEVPESDEPRLRKAIRSLVKKRVLSFVSHEDDYYFTVEYKNLVL